MAPHEALRCPGHPHGILSTLEVYAQFEVRHIRGGRWMYCPNASTPPPCNIKGMNAPLLAQDLPGARIRPQFMFGRTALIVKLWVCSLAHLHTALSANVLDAAYT